MLSLRRINAMTINDSPDIGAPDVLCHYLTFSGVFVCLYINVCAQPALGACPHLEPSILWGTPVSQRVGLPREFQE